jgi:hypothetical protein
MVQAIIQLITKRVTLDVDIFPIEASTIERYSNASILVVWQHIIDELLFAPLNDEFETTKHRKWFYNIIPRDPSLPQSAHGILCSNCLTTSRDLVRRFWSEIQNTNRQNHFCSWSRELGKLGNKADYHIVEVAMILLQSTNRNSRLHGLAAVKHASYKFRFYERQFYSKVFRDQFLVKTQLQNIDQDTKP